MAKINLDYLKRPFTTYLLQIYEDVFCKTSPLKHLKQNT